MRLLPWRREDDCGASCARLTSILIESLSIMLEISCCYSLFMTFLTSLHLQKLREEAMACVNTRFIPSLTSKESEGWFGIISCRRYQLLDLSLVPLSFFPFRVRVESMMSVLREMIVV
mmetsp:Transcript_4908/g.10295  ORF Transcript_4908/g.10295 Transcript_4908/m.10295 type:complete len:118 (+) Transcript_4908:434-787(+)